MELKPKATLKVKRQMRTCLRDKKNLEGTYDQRSKATSFANINNKW